jgi:protein-S-isoprenylcysteine O-methyltransferase Ste14
MPILTETPWFVRIPPPIWMLVMLICAFAVDEASGGIPFVAVPWLAIAFAGAAVVLDVWAFALFRLARTEMLPSSASNKKLVTSGPFRFSRNPMYLGWIMLSLAVGFSIGSLPYFVVSVLMFFLCNNVFIPFEEAKMQRQFCDQYTDYLARVRRWI